MRHRFARGLLVVGALLVIVPAFASAPADQYDAFNRENTTITDHQTHLTWQRFVDAPPSSYEDAMAYCAQLPLEHRSWRLPTVKELLTIVDESPHQEYQLGPGLVQLAIDGRAFPDTPSALFWSMGVAPNVLVVDFSSGVTEIALQLTDKYAVRCVSDNP